MSAKTGGVRVSYRDESHPKVLLKDLKRKRKILQKALKGNYSGLSQEESDAYRNMTTDSILSMIDTYDSRIKSIRSNAWKQGKIASGEVREERRAGWTSFRNSGTFTFPNTNTIKRLEKTKEEEKKELEDL